jgi:outer membrane receptor for ferrienterochelin and colicins
MIGLSVVPKYLSFINLSVGWGKMVRYPDFNSLFWKGDARARGNPELSPERKSQWHVAARLYLPQPYLPSLYVYHYQETVRDLIYWHRTVQGIWEPRNETRVNKKGWDVQLDQRIYGEICKLKLGYSYVDAINKSPEPNRYDMRVIFVPEHSFHGSLNLNIHASYLTVIYRQVSDREITPANTGIPLSPYQLVDLSIGHRIVVQSMDIDLGFVFRNVFNQEYELIRGYPMPGREIQLSVILKYHSQ